MINTSDVKAKRVADRDVSFLSGLELAALSWAGVAVPDRSTWFIRAGGGRE
jgi:hypothetical protein